jgi:hypothetical protein
LVISRAHLQLSGAETMQARVFGPVIGPNARVRPCSDLNALTDMDVICLDVDQGGRIERGYTIKRMVALAPEHGPATPPRRRLVVAGIGAVSAIAGVVGIATVLL